MIEWNELLVEKMKRGEKKAFEQCYCQLSSTIYSAIFRICLNKDTANDLTHDTFIDAFEHIGTFNSARNFVAWIKRIAFNNTFNYISRPVNKVHYMVEEEQLHSIAPTPEQSLETSNQLSQLLLLVSENDRLVLWLFIVEQYSHEEIAMLVNQSPSYSKSIVSRSLKKIRESKEIKYHAC